MEDSSLENLFSYIDGKSKETNFDLAFELDEIKTKHPYIKFYNCLKHILEKSNDTKTLDKLIRYLALNFDKRNLPLLIDFILRPLNDNSFVNIKVMAIKMLPKYNDTSSVQALLFCLNDKNSNYKIKLASAEALGKIGDINAFESLGRIVTDENEESAYIKESAVTALGMLGDERAIDVFSSIMNTKQIFKSKFSFLKEKIMEAMNKFDISKNKKALDIIKKSLFDMNPSVRISAVETLMNSDLTESYDLIFGVLKFDNDTEVRKNALVALYNIKNDITVLYDVIKGEYPDELKEYSKEIIKELEENKDE